MSFSRLLKWFFMALGALVSLGAVAIVLVGWLFSSVFEPHQEELARVPSPSGLLEAVVVETDGGATTPFNHLVYVVERGAQAQANPVVVLRSAIRYADQRGVDVQWSAADQLRVEYQQARSITVNAPTVTIVPHTVYIALRARAPAVVPTVPAPALPVQPQSN